jgi:Family of unknown function (DUF6464)
MIRAMVLNALPTEIILSDRDSSLGYLSLGWDPHPGSYLAVNGETFLVLERRHRYQLKAGRYQLHQMSLYVQRTTVPAERSLWEGRWVIGDATCLYNARSEVLRCAVYPSGPCDRCPHRESAQTPSSCLS